MSDELWPTEQHRGTHSFCLPFSAILNAE